MTRYFGGVLLGAGGLTRAYAKSAKDALDAAGKARMRLWSAVTVDCPYPMLERLKLLAAAHGGTVEGTDFGAAVSVRILLPQENAAGFDAALTELSAGTMTARREGVRRLRRHILRPAVTALGTCSSVATIPANMEAAEDSGIPHEVADLVLPLGATMHMDGSCFSCVLKVAFLFGVFGLPFEGAGLFAEVLAVAVFSSVAMSGIPGGGYIAEFILCSLFFPDRMAVAYPIAVTIGNLVDPPATMVNAAGDYAASFLVARITEGSGWLERTDGERAA